MNVPILAMIIRLLCRERPTVSDNEWIPWRLLLNASGNGFMWLNGQDIGRHLEIGPQREYFLPEC